MSIIVVGWMTFVGVAIVYLLWRAHQCTDHCWSSKEPTGRYKATPWHNKPRVRALEQEVEQHCKHEGCGAERREYEYIEMERDAGEVSEFFTGDSE